MFFCQSKNITKNKIKKYKKMIKKKHLNAKIVCIEFAALKQAKEASFRKNIIQNTVQKNGNGITIQKMKS